jgi:hypothetical protein
MFILVQQWKKMGGSKREQTNERKDKENEYVTVCVSALEGLLLTFGLSRWF